MTAEQYASIGKECRNALEGNLLVGSFAAELVGESYPFCKGQWDILFSNFNDQLLGERFVSWMEKQDHDN